MQKIMKTVTLAGVRVITVTVLALSSLIATALQPAPVAEAVPLIGIGLTVPASVPIGGAVNLTVSFDNTAPNAPGNIGYGPFIDLYFPVEGADGDGAAVDDGIDFVSATYLGLPVIATQLTFPGPGPTGCVNHPYAVAPTTGAPLQVCGPSGDKLVVLQLPFGSFTPDQPAAVINVQATLSNLADLGATLTLRARGGYQYGATPTNDWCCPPFDATILSNTNTNPLMWTPAGAVTPTLLTLTKTYTGPEDETATGPNFPRRYTLTATWPSGQPITNLVITDTLPNNLAFSSVISTAPGGSSVIQTPTVGAAANPPNNDLVVTWPVTLTGGTASVVFEYFVPLTDATGTRVLDAVTGDDATSPNNGEASGGWDPIDARDPVTPTSVSVGTIDHTLNDKSIAIQKSVTPGIVSPGSTLTYTLDFQVSDFFAFESVVISDTFSDGQRWDNTFAPALLINGNTYTLTTAPMAPTNFTVDVSEIGNDPDPATDGSTTVTFRVSDEIVTRGEDGRMVGGCVDESNGSPTPDCALYNDGPTTGTLIFRTVVQDQFSDTYPSGDPSVDHGDVLGNAVTVTGDVLDTATFTPTGQSESDTSGANVAIIFGVLNKTVYALNGNTSFASPVRVRPGDTVTYRLTYSLPTSDFEDLVITDYLPLPVFSASEITVFSDTVSAVPPPAGTWKFGPSETFRALAGNGVGCPIAGNGDGTPCLTVDANSNSLAFSYGDYDDPANTDTDIDLLFTVTVSNDPFADGLFLTNQANAVEGTTNAGSQTLNGIVQIQLTEPVLSTTKGIVATSNSNNVFTPSPNAPVTFNAPGTGAPNGGSARWSGVINSTNLATTNINSNVGGVDAGDLVTFAILIVNSGTSTRGAFDITLTDTLPAGFVIPAGGLNLRVSHGDPSSGLSYTGLGGGPDSIANTADDIFGSGVRIDDPGAAQGACQAHDMTNGLNIIVLTYDLQLDPSVTPLQGIVNTAALTRYAGTEGGPNHLPQPQTDSATTTIANIAVGKSLIATSEAHTAGTRVAVGEIVRYQLTVTLTEGTLPNVIVTDTLPSGLTFLNDGTATLAFVANSGTPITSTTLSGVGLAVTGSSSTVTPTFTIPTTATTPSSFSTGTDPVFSLGTLLNSDSDSDNEYAVIQFNALADNSAVGSNDVGENRDNAFSVRVGTNSPVTSGNARVTIAEPVLTINKTATPTSADAGDTITYTVTLNNAGGANNSTAFETVLTDVLPALLNLNLGSVTIATGGVVTNTANLSAGNTLTVTADAIAPGGVLTITYRATVDTAVGSGQVITNTATALFTSLPGAGTSGNPTGSNTPDPSGGTNGERNGSGTPSHNDHRVTDPATVTVTVTPVKTLVATSEAHTNGGNVVVGEIARYRLAVALPESTALNLQLRDNLPAGLRFLDDGTATVAFICNGGVSCINSSTLGTAPLLSGNAPITPTFGVPGAAIGGGPFGSGTDVTFSLGDVTNSDNDPDTEYVVVEFNALVENVAGNQAGTLLGNTFTVRVNGADVATSASLPVTVVEPNLALNKTVAPTLADAGDVVTYTVLITNQTGASTATAFDTVFTDSVPADLTPDAANCTVNPLAGVTPVIAGNSITVTIDSLAVGSAVTIICPATLNSTVRPGQTITNTGTATTTSLPGAGTSGNPTGSNTPGGSGSTTGERNGDGGVNDYRTTDPASITVPTPSISKALVSTSAAHTTGSNVVIGEIVSYTLVVSLPEGTTPALVVTDAVPGGLAYVSGSAALDLTGFGGSVGAGEPAVASAGGSGDDVIFTFASPIAVTADNNPANNTLTLRLALRVLNVIGNQNATLLPNSATVNAGGAPQTSNTVNATVREPVLTVSKAVDDTTPAPGQTLTYTLTLTHTGASTADALDVTLTDTLPSGLTLVGGSAAIAPAGTVTESAGSLVATVPGLALGNGVTLTYRATVGDPPAVSFGSALTNTVAVQWTSLPGGDPEERTGAGGVNDYSTNTSRTVTVTGVDLQLDKTDNGITTTPGGAITYTLTVTNTGSITATGVLITDTLPANTSFVSASDSGTAIAGTVSWPTFTLAPGAAASRTLIVQVDDPLAAGVTVITNTASVGDDGAGGPDPTPGDNGDSETTPVSGTVDLQLSKDDGQTVVTPGQTLTYTLVITNVGNVAATGVRITDTLPANVTFIGASNGGTAVAGSVTWPAFGLNGGGASTTRTVTVQVNNPLPAGVSAITNTALVADDGASGVDPTPGDNGDTDTDTLTVSVDLRLTKRAASAAVAPGDVLAYTLTYTNVGNVAATGVIITETVPANTAFDAAGSAPNVWSCADGSAAGTTCTLTIGALAGGNASGSVRFAVRIDPALSPSVTQINNTALISDDGTSGADPTPSDNDDDASTPVMPPTSVTLLYFRVGGVVNGNVVLEWATATEVDNFGFKLYRAASNDFGAASEIGFVPAQGSGSTYAHTDTPGNGNWWYWLVDVDTNGVESPHGPVTTAVGVGEAQVRIYLPLIGR